MRLRPVITCLNKNILIGLFVLLPSMAIAAEGKLIGTAGLLQVEGSGGGGIVPWATLAGYDSRDQFSVSAFSTQVNVDDYRLQVFGVSSSFYDRVELGIARQRFEVEALATDIEQTVFSAKYRLYGDVVYSDWPQLSLGVQHKKLHDGDIAAFLGAKNAKQGTDIYVAATKVHLAAIGGYNALWNLTARATKANQMGLLGFGSTTESDYEIMLEASAGILFSRHLALGVEYRQKPDNLGAEEDDWMDVFIAYMPSKAVNFTLAWADLGTIAGADKQQGVYVSMNGQLW